MKIFKSILLILVGIIVGAGGVFAYHFATNKKTTKTEQLSLAKARVAMQQCYNKLTGTDSSTQSTTVSALNDASSSFTEDDADIRDRDNNMLFIYIKLANIAINTSEIKANTLYKDSNDGSDGFDMWYYFKLVDNRLLFYILDNNTVPGQWRYFCIELKVEPSDDVRFELTVSFSIDNVVGYMHALDRGGYLIDYTESTLITEKRIMENNRDITSLDYYHCNTDEKIKIEATEDDFSDDELAKEVGKVLSLTANTDRSFDAFVLSDADNHLLDLSK